MSDAGVFQIEIYDVDALQGVSNGTIELLSFDCIQTDSISGGGLSYPKASYQNIAIGGNNGAKPVLVRGRGPSLGANYIGNPVVDISWDAGNFEVKNNQWATFYDPSLISGSPYPLSNSNESAYFYFETGGMVNVATLFQTGSLSKKRAILDLYSLTGTRYWVPEVIVRPTGTSTQDAWVSYDTSSGMTSKVAVGYSVSILNMISGITGNFNAQHSSGSIIHYLGTAQSGYCNIANLFLAQSGKSCVSPPQNTDEAGNPTPIQSCVPSGLTSGQLTGTISEILQSYIQKESMLGEAQGQDTSNEISNGIVTVAYKQYSGYIDFNTPISGDSFFFEAYNILGGYTGSYQNIFGSLPPYNDISFTWRFGVDYSGIDDFISLVNTNLYTTSYHLWHNYPCLNNSTSGYYENGPLLQLYKISNNQIGVISSRIDAAGNYSLGFNNIQRSTDTTLNVIKYMVPSTIQFQASNDNIHWNVLDSHSGIDWFSIPGSYTKHTTGITLNDVSGVFSTSGDNANDISITGGPVKKVIYSAVATGKDRCGNPFSQQIDFYELPSGITSCADQSPSGGLNDIKVDGLGAQKDISGQVVQSEYLKTGWKFLNSTGYNHYRLYFSDFQNHGRGWVSQYTNEFEIDNINIYGITTGYYLHSGNMCLVGATYSNQIQGFTTGIVTGFTSGFASQTTSGKYVFDNVLVNGIANGNGLVTFQNATGQAVGLFTGIHNETLTGIAFYLQEIGGYFYDVASQSVYFTAPVSGLIIGSGNLTGGPYNVIQRSFVETGITGFQKTIVSQDVLVSGQIDNYLLTLTNIAAFSYTSGAITGNVTGTGGYLLYENDIAIIPSAAYTNLISGTRESSTVLHFNLPSAGDTIFINGAPLIFETGLGFNAPTYFGNINTLNDIINSGQATYGVTSNIFGNSINLTSLNLGVSGNLLSTTSSPSIGSTGCPTFDSLFLTGGQTYFYPASPLGVFTGHVTQKIFATGIYTGIGSGTMTGTIKNLLFVRKFSGIWDLRTGDVDFNTNGWLTGENTYTSSSFIPNLSFSGDLNAVPIYVVYKNSPFVNSIDTAILSITGSEFGTGLSMRVSGVF